MALTAVGRSMPWGEAYRLTRALLSDPSSHVAASLVGWEHPISREALATLDVFDLQHEIAWAQGGRKGPKPKPHPMRPAVRRKTERRGREQVLTQDEIVDVLRKAGHTAPLPTRGGDRG